MGFPHDSVQGIHLLHWLTVAAPLATLVVVSGMLHPTKAARLLLVGVATTFATGMLDSVAPGSSHVRYGAPLPFVRAGLDPLTSDPSTALTILRTCFVADLVFWCSSTVLLGVLIQTLARRMRRARWSAHRSDARRHPRQAPQEPTP